MAAPDMIDHDECRSEGYADAARTGSALASVGGIHARRRHLPDHSRFTAIARPAAHSARRHAEFGWVWVLTATIHGWLLLNLILLIIPSRKPLHDRVARTTVVRTRS
jgi:hypothetical protein